jgi:sugar/nucleoside kinase (ribokinase family)
LSGYQLASPCGELLTSWLEGQDVTAFIDFGPRIADIPDSLMARIMACRPIVSLNRQEASRLKAGVSPSAMAAAFRRRADCAS